MMNHFKLAVSLNYKGTLFKITILLLLTFAPIIITITSITQGLISSESIRFEIVFPLYLIFIAGLTFLFAKRNFKINEVHMGSESITFSKSNSLNYIDVYKYKTNRFRGYTTYIIILKNGKRIALTPSSNFSSKANDEFESFMLEFEKRMIDFT